MDGAILDVTNFPQRHPGGARLIHNAVGTDITHELLGEELSLGHAMSFSPHAHPKVGLVSLHDYSINCQVIVVIRKAA